MHEYKHDGGKIMFIGYLENVKYDYFRMGTEIPFPYDRVEDECLVWPWNAIYNSALDIRAALPNECYVGGVTLSFGKYSKLYRAEIVSDGKVIGKYTAETGKTFEGNVTIPVGASLRGFVIRLYSAISSIMLREIRISAAYDDNAPLVWPTPKHSEYSDE